MIVHAGLLPGNSGRQPAADLAPPIWARPADRDEWADAHPTTRPELDHDEIREGLALLAQVPECAGTQAPVLIVAAKAVLLRGDGAAAHVLRLLRAEFGGQS